MSSPTNSNGAAGASAARDAVMNSRESKICSNRSERIVILLFCFAAALRVFIFSAAFPFFSNVDESLHFDLIIQYSRGHLPRSFDRLTEETLNWIVPYASAWKAHWAPGYPGVVLDSLSQRSPDRARGLVKLRDGANDRP